jgi:hypothetical protein
MSLILLEENRVLLVKTIKHPYSSMKYNSSNYLGKINTTKIKKYNYSGSSKRDELLASRLEKVY